MSFTIEPLTQDDAFFNDADTSPTVVDGVGQMVYFKKCFVKVYDSANTSKPLQTFEACDGQGRVPRGTSLVLGGIGGLVKKT